MAMIVVKKIAARVGESKRIDLGCQKKPVMSINVIGSIDMISRVFLVEVVFETTLNSVNCKPMRIIPVFEKNGWLNRLQVNEKATHETDHPEVNVDTFCRFFG